MLITLSIPVIIVVNVLLWLFFHMGVSFLLTQLPVSWFKPDGLFFRLGPWEQSGVFFERFFRVHHWKKYLPDGAALFKRGFQKKKLRSRESEYYARFTAETCRGELTHWMVLFLCPVFFIWNWWWAGLIMIVYAIFANVPCIIVQRYNRARLLMILKRRAISIKRLGS